ncbi:MAG: cation:proton antiporter [Cyanobacteriota bacterium]|nr:cation:proton antiporter [Cyanobacteriota bacterium]
MDVVITLLREEPIVTFAFLLGIILVVPILFEWMRLPGLVGLLFAGVLFGPNGLNFFDGDTPTIKLLSDVGVVYLLFVAGLEIDLEQFRQTKHRSAGFGLLTFAIPMLMGTMVGRLFGFGWNAAILVGSLFASHTPLGYPIVSRFGLVRNEAVLVTIGGTIFTDIASLLVLAVCVGIHAGEFSLTSLVILLGSLLLYAAAILFGLDWVGQEFFRRSGEDEGNQFLFVLLALFLAALGAQVIGVEKIVGAFLAGLAVNDVVREGPVKEKVVFVGSVLFIPVFFVDVGLLLDLPVFLKTVSSFWLAASILLGLSLSKLLAAFISKWLYRYSWAQMVMMFSLSLPQVAATLAATLVGYRVGLLTEGVLNSVIVLMLVTATAGPILTSRAANQMMQQKETVVEPELPTFASRDGSDPFAVVVPLANPETETDLLEMAALVARHEGGYLVPLSIATAHIHMDAPSLETSLQHSQFLLQRAVELAQQWQVEARPLIRIDSHVAQGISHATREQKAQLIVMGWSETSGLRARLFGNVIDSVLWASHCPVAIARLRQSPSKLRHILVALENFRTQSARSVRFAQILADVNQAQVTLLHICQPLTSESQKEWIQAQLMGLVAVGRVSATPDIQVICHDDVVKTILQTAQSFDLLVLPSFRRRNRRGGLSMSSITTQVLQRVSCSVVMLGEPL